MVTVVTVLYDNHARSGLWPGWGFSAYLSTEEGGVLFDAGADRLVFEHNAHASNCDLPSVGTLALSHEHCDHIGGALAVFHKGLNLYVPAAFAKRFAGEARNGIHLIAVRGATRITSDVQSIGQFGHKIREQALLVEGREGPALITGCAHEGIVNVVRRATRITQRPLRTVLGGFHLYRREEVDARSTADQLLKLGVERIAPCHCTGDTAIRILQDAFGDRFLDIAAGSKLEI